MNKTSKHLTVMDGMEAVVTNAECSLHSKLQGLKSAGTLILILITLALALAATACKDKPDDPPPPQPHQSTITAFGKTAQVTGDAAISTADFNTAVKNLSDTLIYIYSLIDQLPGYEDGLINMMDRGITIVIGNAAPASVNGALTVGVDYLKASDREKIGEDIATLVAKGAFAD